MYEVPPVALMIGLSAAVGGRTPRIEAIWAGLTNDRRFAGKGFKRQVPVGAHITDFVSFPLRIVIDLVPAGESSAAAIARSSRGQWLRERGYRVVEVAAPSVESDLTEVLDRLAQELAKG